MALEEKTARGGRERAAMVLKFKVWCFFSLRGEGTPFDQIARIILTSRKRKGEDICGRSRRRNVGCVGTRNELNSFLR